MKPCVKQIDNFWMIQLRFRSSFESFFQYTKDEKIDWDSSQNGRGSRTDMAVGLVQYAKKGWRTS